MVITLRDVTLCCQPLMLLKCMLLLGGVLWCLSIETTITGDGHLGVCYIVLWKTILQIALLVSAALFVLFAVSNFCIC